eukprot:TRINITY_DN20036_c0_g1_i2.p1 TRINITY_DN20036_c0_g1~~TRINITY_DN20036_c0_g1_i2.p1  ORF type:complete len:232 (-),score=19.12 TRINITY_DN20036_c0_g1_i2:113-808(-)
MAPGRYRVTNTFSTLGNSVHVRASGDKPWRVRSASVAGQFANELVRQYTCQPKMRWTPSKSFPRQHVTPGPGPSANALPYRDGDWPCTPAAAKAAKCARLRQIYTRSVNKLYPTQRRTYVPPPQRQPHRPGTAGDVAARASGEYLTAHERQKLPKRCQSAPTKRKNTGVYVQRGAGERGHLCERAYTMINFCPSTTGSEHRIGMQNATHNSTAAGRPPSRNAQGTRTTACY